MRAKYILIRLFFVAVGLIAFPAASFSEQKCVDAEGEAAIVRGDVPSAKTEAVARAKWTAIEQAVGVEVRAASVVQNFSLVDDAVIKGIRGVIAGFKILDEKNTGDTVIVKINACIEPSKAEDAVMSLAMNNSLVVLIPAKDPETGQYEESNALSEALISKLIDHGYQVMDAAPGDVADAEMVEKAMKTGNYMTLRALLYKYMSNVLLIGKIDYNISTKKGEDVGYGLSMPVNNVTVRMTYRMLTRDKTGRNVILASGSDEAKGMAFSVEDARQNGIKALRDKVTPAIVDAMTKHLNAASKKISLSVPGVADLNANFAVKGSLQNIAWVTSVEEKGLGEFMVGYPENIIYLLNSLTQMDYRLVKFTSVSATVEQTSGGGN
ncbi:MAG: hypothetical protein Q8J64_09840 [Thermodesulfovibrionales bacterium]|nr:hypothetical protein [Thermodesulfovibrionales bacterium]